MELRPVDRHFICSFFIPPIKCQVRQRCFLTQMIMFLVENLKCKPDNKAEMTTDGSIYSVKFAYFKSRTLVPRAACPAGYYPTKHTVVVQNFSRLCS